MNAPKSYRLEIAGVVRDLPVVEVAPKFRIAIMDLLGDYELTRAAAKALAALMPPDAEVLVMPEGKAIGLLQALQEETGLPGVVPRKRKTSYMAEPVIEAEAVSVTTKTPHRFFLGADKVAMLKGKRVVTIDDVISSRGTQDAIDVLLDKAKAIVVGTMAVGTEGQERPEVIKLHHFPVFPG